MNVTVETRQPYWYVVFQDVPQPKRWQYLLKTGFQHVWAFTYEPSVDGWIKFEPNWDGILIRVYTGDEATQMIAEAQKGTVILKGHPPYKQIWKARLLLACTSQILHLLGIDLFYHTPYRVFCELRKRGFEVSFRAEKTLTNKDDM